LRSTLLASIVVCLGALLGSNASASVSIATHAPLTVFAASSMKEAIDAVAAAWTAQSGQRVAVSYAASSALARQIERDAPADVFISADTEWVDYLAGRHLIAPGSRFNLARNALVLIAPAAAPAKSAPAAAVQAALSGAAPAQVMLQHAALSQALGADGRLAVAETDSVPAGRYARQSLTALGLWPTVANRLAPAENVRAALAFVARGEAPLGIVYETDARAEPRVRVVARFPNVSHAPILYAVARVAASPGGRSSGFLAFLRGSRARAILSRAGFGAP
jgi:molybdate transport system substrate-binding protein